MTILMDQDVESDLPVQLNEDIERVIQQTLSLEHCPYECEVNITFTDNDGIRMINREFRELDVPTDVLSFPIRENVITSLWEADSSYCLKNTPLYSTPSTFIVA